MQPTRALLDGVLKYKKLYTEFATPPVDTGGALLQRHSGAVPLHVPAVAWHVHVDPAAGLTPSPVEHDVVTPHVAPPSVVEHPAATTCVAPAVAATVSIGQ